MHDYGSTKAYLLLVLGVDGKPSKVIISASRYPQCQSGEVVAELHSTQATNYAAARLRLLDYLDCQAKHTPLWAWLKNMLG